MADDPTGTRQARALVTGVMTGLPLMAGYSMGLEGGALGVVATLGAAATVRAGVAAVRAFDRDDLARRPAAELGDEPVVVLREVA